MQSLLIIGLLLYVPACKTTDDSWKKVENNPEFLHRGMRRLVDIIRHDIFAPTVAARIYAYSSIAAYEALVPGFPEYRSLVGNLNGLTAVPQPEAGKDYCFPLASANAMLTVGKALIFSESSMDDLKEKVLEDFEKMNIPKDVYDRSMAYGDAVAKHILGWSKGDNYAQTRSAPKFTIRADELSRWRPTPPQYGDALEPHWMEIRPWTLDSAFQFHCDPPPPFSKEKNSAFYKNALVTMDAVKNLTKEQENIAWYWDDNPFAVEISGHLTISRKKISPAGHWIIISTYACRAAKADMMKSAETYVKVSCAMADGFISCWAEKYRTNLVRPETYINELIDRTWRPLIETPPFPEHTSGHATVSACASSALTGIYGENFAFTDSTEAEFGLGTRSFKSFYEASDEAAMSRLYGGIHYPTGNESGKKNGRLIGAFVHNKLKTKR